MGQIKYNNITNEILLSSTSGNTIVLEDTTTPAYAPPQDQLIRHWTMAEDTFNVSTKGFADEVSGTTIYDTLSGATFTTDHNGNTNSALAGADYYLNMSPGTFDDLSTGSASWSVCYWVNGNASISVGDGFWGYGNNSLRQSAGSQIWWVDGPTNMHWRGTYYQDEANATTLDGPTGSTWWWICETYDGTNIKVYGNNELYFTYPVALNVGNTTYDFTLMKPIADPYYWGGYMDNFMYYKKELSAAERLDIFTNQ